MERKQKYMTMSDYINKAKGALQSADEIDDFITQINQHTITNRLLASIANSLLALVEMKRMRG